MRGGWDKETGGGEIRTNRRKKNALRKRTLIKATTSLELRRNSNGSTETQERKNGYRIGIIVILTKSKKTWIRKGKSRKTWSGGR